MERYTRVAGATPRALPLTLDQAKQHLRIDFQGDDLTIKSLIEAARDWFELRVNRTLTTTTWKLTRDCFPYDDCELMLRFPPLVTVDSVKYYDGDNVQQTWANTNYHAILDDFVCGALRRAHDIEWPTPAYDRPDMLQITFTAGYGSTAASVPAIAKQCLLLLVGHWYENREAVITGTISKEVELCVESICRAMHTGNLAGSGNR